MIVLSAVAAAETEEFTVYNVTPGLAGFAWFFILALAGWVLFRSLTRHMRKVSHNARLLEEREDDDERSAPGSH